MFELLNRHDIWSCAGTSWRLSGGAVVVIAFLVATVFGRPASAKTIEQALADTNYVNQNSETKGGNQSNTGVIDLGTMGTYGPKPTSAPAGAIILNAGDNISAIVSAAPAGATFYFEPGVYRGVSFAPKNGQKFIGAEGAILNGSAVLTNWTQQRQSLGHRRPDAARSASRHRVKVWRAFMRPGYPETVFVDNTPLKPVDALSKVVPGTFYFDYAADKIYIADNPTGHTVEAGKLTDAFHGKPRM